MPKQDADASELNEGEEILGMPFVAGDEPSVVVKPREESLDLPTPPVPAQRPTILGRGALATSSVRTDQFDSSLAPQPLVQRVAVVGPVADQSIGVVGQESMVERLLNEGDFMRRSTRDPAGDRKTSAVCNCHDLGPLPALRLPDAGAPSLAPAKVPSMKASLMSIPPRS